MTKTSMIIWEREFNLNMYFQSCADKTMLEKQTIAYNAFLKSEGAIAAALPKLKAYIEKNYSTRIPEKQISNIFKYVIPKMIFVPKQSGGNAIALMCDFKFDLEHGLALVFVNEQLKEIGSQDIIL